MLGLPNLDDRTYEQIVQAARLAIPKQLPDWTDENAHDPGMTMVELFAWLTEMQQYFLDRVTDRNMLKMFKLLGIRPKDAISARTIVEFSGSDTVTVVPQWTKLSAHDLTFETMEPLYVATSKIERVLTRTETETTDNTSANVHNRVAYYAFGSSPTEGNRLYIGFDKPLPPFTLLTLGIKLDTTNSQLPDRPERDIDFAPPSELVWSYYGVQDEPMPEGARMLFQSTKADNNLTDSVEKVDSNGDVAQDKPNWHPIPIIQDETRHFTFDGLLQFQITGKMRPLAVYPANDSSRYWISCALKHNGYECAPRIDRISLNCMSVLQRDSLSRFQYFSGTGEAGQQLSVHDHISYASNIELQVQEKEDAWRTWQLTNKMPESQAEPTYVYMLERDPFTKQTVITFGDGLNGLMPPQGKRNIRVISYTNDLLENRTIGRSNGLPGQRYEVLAGPVQQHSIKLQVGSTTDHQNELLWHDWERVDDFDHSGPDDRHFIFDPVLGEVIFGDRIRGNVPPVCQMDMDNIRFLSLQTGGGVRGNVKSGSITSFVHKDDDWEHLTPNNAYDASDGAERETLQDTGYRMHLELNEPTRAVTNDDYERIALKTPGVRIAKAKALPLYEPGMPHYPQRKADGQMTLVIVPFSHSERPMPNSRVLETVKRHVNKYRLITTELHVMPPTYIEITVRAIIAVQSHSRDIRANVVDALKRILRPVDPDAKEGGQSWTFGQSVVRGDLFAALNAVNGVEFVQDLHIDASGAQFVREPNGDIRIPPYGLVFSGDHEIEIR